jgi:hypothetical protein
MDLLYLLQFTSDEKPKFILFVRYYDQHITLIGLRNFT